MDWIALREKLVEQFSDGELRDLCFDLDIDYEALPGAAKGEKARELIAFCQRHDRVADLLARCEALRPHGRWHEVSDGPPSGRASQSSGFPSIPPHAAGDVIMATVGAGASNVAVGKDITQQIGGNRGEDGQATLNDGLSAVEHALQSAEVDAGTAAMATFQLGLLRGELLKGSDEQPSASTLVQVGDWLLKHVPHLREPMAHLFTAPAATRALHRAGPQAVTWAQQFHANR